MDYYVWKVPDPTKETVLRRLAILVPAQPLKQFRASQNRVLFLRWFYERRRTLTPDRRSQILDELACAELGAPYVARGLVGHKEFDDSAVWRGWRGRLASTGSHLEAIVNRMKKSKPGLDGKAQDERACPGVKGFNEKDWQTVADLEKYVKAHLAEEAKATSPENLAAPAAAPPMLHSPSTSLPTTKP
jgi:hypothetical protein